MVPYTTQLGRMSYYGYYLFIYLFIVYLKTLLLLQIIERQMEWIWMKINMNWKDVERRVPGLN
jgi:hypothetical protein